MESRTSRSNIKPFLPKKGVYLDAQISNSSLHHRWFWERSTDSSIIKVLALPDAVINAANNTLTNALPRLADELIKIALDQNKKAFARTAAISEAFKIVNTNVLEAKQRKQLQAIRAHLDSLEDGGTPVIDV